MIISVGYRVNSHRGVQFRKWVTQVLKEYMIFVTVQQGCSGGLGGL